MKLRPCANSTQTLCTCLNHPKSQATPALVPLEEWFAYCIKPAVGRSSIGENMFDLRVYRIKVEFQTRFFHSKTMVANPWPLCTLFTLFFSPERWSNRPEPEAFWKARKLLKKKKQLEHQGPEVHQRFKQVAPRSKMRSNTSELLQNQWTHKPPLVASHHCRCRGHKADLAVLNKFGTHLVQQKKQAATV